MLINLHKSLIIFNWEDDNFTTKCVNLNNVFNSVVSLNLYYSAVPTINAFCIFHRKIIIRVNLIICCFIYVYFQWIILAFLNDAEI